MQLSKQTLPNGVQVTISGDIDEHADFVKLIGIPASGEVVINARQVSRINSAGCRNWVLFRKKLDVSSVGFRVQECAFVLLEQASMMSDFIPPGTLDSAEIVFFCKSCGTEQSTLMDAAEFRKAGSSVADRKCLKCGKLAAFEGDATLLKALDKAMKR